VGYQAQGIKLALVLSPLWLYALSLVTNQAAYLRIEDDDRVGPGTGPRALRESGLSAPSAWAAHRVHRRGPISGAAYSNRGGRADRDQGPTETDSSLGKLTDLVAPDHSQACQRTFPFSSISYSTTLAVLSSAARFWGALSKCPHTSTLAENPGPVGVPTPHPRQRHAPRPA
jgi:hypothetical protein